MPSAVSTFACALWRLRLVMATISGSVRIILCSRWTQRTTRVSKEAWPLVVYLHWRWFSKVATSALLVVQWPCPSVAPIIGVLIFSPNLPLEALRAERVTRDGMSY